MAILVLRYPPQPHWRTWFCSLRYAISGWKYSISAEPSICRVPVSFSSVSGHGREAPAFSLDGSNGKKLSLRDHLGKVVILQFGFTFCEKVCPVTLARMTEVYKKLGTAARDVQLIYVTVDPERDSRERFTRQRTAHAVDDDIDAAPPGEACDPVYEALCG
jgi:cytochrome oxidase Cu insertion factor (SCO1/SenC/PrrC family)